MTVHQLEYFINAAHSLNFTKTAEAFYISQSAITQQIKNLENELGVSLFIRKKNKLTLTSAGYLFLQETEKILAKIHDSVDKVRAVQEGKTGTISIGYLKSMEMSRFPRSVQNFHNKYPGVRISLKRDNAIHLHDDFLHGKYDLIFNIKNEFLPYSDAVQIEVGKYPLYVVLPPGHPMTQKKIILQDDLKYEKIIIHDLSRSVSGSQELVPRKYLKNDLMPNVICTEDDAETILIMVAAGTGIGILPDYDIHHPQVNLNLIYIPLETYGYAETLQVIYSKKNDNPLIPLFMEEV